MRCTADACAPVRYSRGATTTPSRANLTPAMYRSTPNARAWVKSPALCASSPSRRNSPTSLFRVRRAARFALSCFAMLMLQGMRQDASRCAQKRAQDAESYSVPSNARMKGAQYKAQPIASTTKGTISVRVMMHSYVWPVQLRLSAPHLTRSLQNACICVKSSVRNGSGHLRTAGCWCPRVSAVLSAGDCIVINELACSVRVVR